MEFRQRADSISVSSKDFFFEEIQSGYNGASERRHVYRWVLLIAQTEIQIQLDADLQSQESRVVVNREIVLSSHGFAESYPCEVDILGSQVRFVYDANKAQLFNISVDGVVYDSLNGLRDDLNSITSSRKENQSSTASLPRQPQDTDREESKQEEGSSRSDQERGIVRLVNVKASSLADFKREIEPFLPTGDAHISNLEVYLGELTAAQLGHLFQLMAANGTDTIGNVLFWKVTFLPSTSAFLEQQLLQAAQRLQHMTTLMVYCCQFLNESSRQALHVFANNFAEHGSSLTRLWLESFYKSGEQARSLFDNLEANDSIKVENLDLGQNKCFRNENCIDSLSRLIERTPTLVSLGLDHCQLPSNQLKQILEALNGSRSRTVFKKLYIKNNKCNEVGVASQLCQLVNQAPLLQTVHLNWTGVKLKLEAGRQISVIATSDETEIAQAPTKRTQKINN